MELLIVVIALIFLAVKVLSHNSLADRVSRLEARLQQYERSGRAIQPAVEASEPRPFVASTPIAAAEFADTKPAPVPRYSPPPVVPRVETAGSIFGNFKLNMFAVTGVGLLMLGFLFIFRSIEWGQLLSPTMRVGLGWAAAGGLGFAGLRLHAKNALWGQIAQGGAAALAYFATYMGTQQYELLSPETSFVAFIGISVALTWRALIQDNVVLAAMGILGAFITPLLSLQAHGSLGLNLTFGLLVTVCALGISYSKRWVQLGVYAHVCAVGLAAITYAEQHAALSWLQQQLVLNAYLAAMVGWAVLWARAYHSREAAPDSERVVLPLCLGVSSVAYLSLQMWLLSSYEFTIVAGVSALGLAVLAQRRFVSAGLLLCALPALVTAQWECAYSVTTATALAGAIVFAWLLDAAMTTNSALAGKWSGVRACITASLPFLSFVPVMVASAEHTLSSAPWTFINIACIGAWLAWLMLSQWGTTLSKAIWTSAAGATVAFVYCLGLLHGPSKGLSLALTGRLLPLTVAALGVAWLVHSSKQGDRGAWTSAAVLCVTALAGVLLAMGGAVRSPTGIAVSLLSMGALFLLAGLLAPLPPADSD